MSRFKEAKPYKHYKGLFNPSPVRSKADCQACVPTTPSQVLLLDNRVRVGGFRWSVVLLCSHQQTLLGPEER